MTPTEELAAAQFASVVTYRRDGRPVATPVWIVGFGDALAFSTGIGSGKVKRVRRNPEVAVATCDREGRNLGPAYPGRAEILGEEDSRRVREEIRRKYRVPGRLASWLSRLRGDTEATVGVRVMLRGVEPLAHGSPGAEVPRPGPSAPDQGRVG